MNQFRDDPVRLRSIIGCLMEHLVSVTHSDECTFRGEGPNGMEYDADNCQICADMKSADEVLDPQDLAQGV
jgi:hypothetical protein